MITEVPGDDVHVEVRYRNSFVSYYGLKLSTHMDFEETLHEEAPDLAKEVDCEVNRDTKYRIKSGEEFDTLYDALCYVHNFDGRPYYCVRSVNSRKERCVTSFHSFEEMVEWFHQNDVAEYTISGDELTQEERNFVQAVVNSRLMGKFEDGQ